MRLGCLVAFGALYMIWAGGQGLYTAVKNREPMELSCASYDDVKPNKEWLRLTGCELNVLEASYMEENGRVVELFIPARGPGEEEGDPIQVVLATKDETLTGLANEMAKIEDEMELIQFFAEHRDRLYSTRQIEGLVRYGVNLDSGDREELMGLDENLASDFVIVDEGKRPRFAGSLGFLGGGFVLLLGVGAVAAGGSES